MTTVFNDTVSGSYGSYTHLIAYGTDFPELYIALVLPRYHQKCQKGKLTIVMLDFQEKAKIGDIQYLCCGLNVDTCVDQ